MLVLPKCELKPRILRIDAMGTACLWGISRSVKASNFNRLMNLHRKRSGLITTCLLIRNVDEFEFRVIPSAAVRIDQELAVGRSRVTHYRRLDRHRVMNT